MNEIDYLLQQIDAIKYEYLHDNPKEKRKDLSQYFSSGIIANFMATFVSIEKEEYRILDPGAGTGLLSSALVGYILNSSKHIKKIYVTAIEKDPDLYKYLCKTFEVCSYFCKKQNIIFNYEIINKDFIEYGYEVLSSLNTENLFPSEQEIIKYDIVITNPPYKKIENLDVNKKYLDELKLNTANLYTAFLSISQELINEDGEIIAITPRSFCNGTYFKSFRTSFFSKLYFHKIHLFNLRDKAFNEDDILQENIIYKVSPVKPKNNKIEVTTKDKPEDEVYKIYNIEHDLVILPSDKNKIVHLITDNHSLQILKRITSLKHKLQETGLTVSTGKIVDYRIMEYLLKSLQGNDAPLLYPFHFEKGFIKYPNQNKKKSEAVVINENTMKLLVPNGYYVLCKRFSTNEEKKRIVASVFNPNDHEFAYIGIENHLNYYHRENLPLDKDVAKGLSLYLNSTVVDHYFRLFNGHTQVNADDLRYLPYPSILELKSLGNYYSDELPDQEVIDDIIERELFKMSTNQNPTLITKKISEALNLLKQLGLPKDQQNERSALVLLALLNIKPNDTWKKAQAPLIGITPIMNFIKTHYEKEYAANTRETIRKDSVQHFVLAGILIQNPDDPNRPVNSPNFVYQVETKTLELIKKYKTRLWEEEKRHYLANIKTLTEIYAQRRDSQKIPITLSEKEILYLSPGGQNTLIEKILKDFQEYFVRNGVLIYVGDAKAKFSYYNDNILKTLNVDIKDQHGKMPDVILYYPEKNWLILIEAVSSNGPITPKRKIELEKLFAGSTAGLVLITAFETKKSLASFLDKLSWETDVWTADNPSHLVHLDGKRFLGPYVKE